MNSEISSSNDNLPPKPPNNGGSVDDRPDGYPPAGQQQRLAEIREAEAAETAEDLQTLTEMLAILRGKN
jgi:hypothetical protein